MKRKYVSPELEVFALKDIVTTSGDDFNTPGAGVKP
jgi:hypothetical protein